MPRNRMIKTIAVTAAALFATVALSGPAAAEPTTDTLSQSEIDNAKVQLQGAAAGNPEAQDAISRIVADQQKPEAPRPNLPAQIFPIPVYSDTGQGGPVLGQLYGTGVATDVNNEFRFGFFGGPGVIADNQAGAELSVVWYSTGNGASGITRLDQNNKVIPTVISTAPVNVGDGTIFAAVYGTTWHKVNNTGDPAKDFAKSTIWFPSLGIVRS